MRNINLPEDTLYIFTICICVNFTLCVCVCEEKKSSFFYVILITAYKIYTIIRFDIFRKYKIIIIKKFNSIQLIKNSNRNNLIFHD